MKRIRSRAGSVEGPPPSRSRLRSLPFSHRARRAATDRRAREIHLGSVANLGDRVVLLAAADGRLVDVNAHASEAYGYSRDELLGMRIGALRATNLDSLQDVISGDVSRYETVHLRRDGSRIDVEVTARPIRVGTAWYVQEIVQDITRQKAAEERVLENESKFRAIFERSVDAIGVSRAGDHVIVNPAYVSMFGYDNAEEILTLPVVALIAPSERARIEQYTKDRAAGLVVPTTYITRGIRKDGTEFDFEIRVSATNFGGEQALIVIIRDVTERLRAEAEVRRVTDELELFFDTAVDLLCIADFDGYFRRVNREWERALGYTTEDLKDRRFLDLVYPDDLQPTLNAMSRLSHGETVINFLNRYVAKDGSLHWIEWKSSPGGNVIIAAARDVTERLERENAMREMQLRLDTVLANTPIVLFLIDRDGIFRYSDGRGLRSLGLAPGEVVGRHFVEVYGGNQTIIESVSRAIAGEEIRIAVEVGPLTFDTLYAPFVELDGTRNGTIGLAIDVSADREAQRKLKASLDDKDILLKEVHHRVKNNMQVMSSLLQMHIAQTGDARARSVLEVARDRISSMSLIHEQVYQTGEFARVDVTDYAKRLAGTLASSFDASNVAFSFEGRLEVPLDVAIPCGLVLNELFMNCLKHAFPGRRVGKVRVSASAEGGEALLVVRDDGVGIAGGAEAGGESTLGVRLLKLLVEKQLSGRIEFAGDAGTEVRIAFPLPA